MDKLLSAVNGKTYLAGLGLLCAAGLKAYEKDFNAAIQLGFEALGILGIGHKIQKASDRAMSE